MTKTVYISLVYCRICVMVQLSKILNQSINQSKHLYSTVCCKRLSSAIFTVLFGYNYYFAVECSDYVVVICSHCCCCCCC